MPYMGKPLLNITQADVDREMAEEQRMYIRAREEKLQHRAAHMYSPSSVTPSGQVIDALIEPEPSSIARFDGGLFILVTRRSIPQSKVGDPPARVFAELALEMGDKDTRVAPQQYGGFIIRGAKMYAPQNCIRLAGVSDASMATLYALFKQGTCYAGGYTMIIDPDLTEEACERLMTQLQELEQAYPKREFVSTTEEEKDEFEGLK